MPGVYLTVWPYEKINEDYMSNEDAVLKPTSGGYPHITLLYAINNTENNIENNTINTDTLFEIGLDAAKRLREHEFSIEQAYINSFEKNGIMRYDVLMEVDHKLKEKINDIRAELKNMDVIMRTPHITHGIFWNKNNAEKACDKVNSMLPYSIKIIGYTI